MKRKVPIKNIYYMLSYVWDDINLFKHGMINVNDDFSAAEMMADLFLYYTSKYLKRGIIHDYIEQEEEIRGIKGKINFNQTLNQLSLQNAKIVCNFDEYIINNIINRIIKSVALLLYRSNSVTSSRRVKLNILLHQFNNVDFIELTQQCFQIEYSKHNLHAKHLMDVCQLILKQRVFSDEKKNIEFLEVYDNENEFAILFEKFVFMFLRSKLAKKIKYQKNLVWNISGSDSSWLPKMKIDILIEDDSNVYILDTKYSRYFYSTQVFDNTVSERLITGHLYQVNAYLTNYQTLKNKIGILVYPKPYSGKMIDLKYDYQDKSITTKNQLRVKTIDLEYDWKEIEKQLILIFNK